MTIRARLVIDIETATRIELTDRISPEAIATMRPQERKRLVRRLLASMADQMTEELCKDLDAREMR